MVQVAAQCSTNDEPARAAALDFIPQLESLRGIACLVVALCHCLLTFRFSDETGCNLQQIGLQLFNGTGAVVLFFVLSGYVLEMALWRDEAGLVTKAAKFYLRRALRIYPAALCVTCLAAAYLWWLHAPTVFESTGDWYREWYNEPFTIHDFATSAAMASFKANHIAWTLQVELLASAAIPFVHWFSRRIPDVARLAVLSMFIALSFMSSAPLLARYFYMFYLGMLCAQARLASRQPAPQRPVLAVLTGLAVVGWIWAGTLYPVEPGLLVQALCSATIVGAATLGGGSRRNCLDVKSLRFLGRISYSFYLVHFLCLYLITRLMLTNFPSLGEHRLFALGLLVVLSLVSSVGCGWFLHCFVEQRAIRLGRRLAAGI